MSRQYFVIAKEICPRCGGDRMIDELHPLTQDPHKVECPDCRGNGFIESRVELADAIMHLDLPVFNSRV